MNNQYRVLHIFSGFGGGISSLILNLIENKSEDFLFDTLAFSYKGGEDFVEKLKKSGSQCYTMPRPRMDGYINFVKYVSDIFSKNKYDAIHCHISGFRTIPFKKIAKANGINIFIIHAHSARYDSKIDRILHVINKQINYNVATDYFTCSDLASKYIFGKNYLKKREALLMPNGIKKEMFATRLSSEETKNYKQTINISKNQKIIAHIGRFSKPKNHEFLLKIMQKVKEQHKDFILLFVGDGERFDYIKGLASNMHITDCVVFCGRRSDIPHIMQFADCIVLPSEYEGLPTVAVESQAAGTPIVLSDKITRQCDMGLDLVRFVPINSVDDWVRAIEEAMKTPLETSLLNAQDNIKKIEKNGFTSDAVGKFYCDTLKKIVKRMRDYS